MEKLKLGLIGCGGMMKRHAEAIQLLENVEITAVCDNRIGQAEAVAEVLDHPHITADYTTMLPYVDAVLVALPHHLHFSCGMFLLLRNRLVRQQLHLHILLYCRF